MDKPIINPAWIWGIDALSQLECIAIFCTAALFVICIIALASYAFFLFNEYKEDYEPDVKTNKVRKKWLTRGFVALFLGILITVAIPTKTTMYTMLVTSYITQENLEIGQSAVEDAVDYIIEKVNDLQGNNENSEDTVEE